MPSVNTRKIVSYCYSIPNIYFATFYAGDNIDNSHSTKVLYLSDEPIRGNARGKIKLTGSTWKQVYDKLVALKIDVKEMANMPWVE